MSVAAMKPDAQHPAAPTALRRGVNAASSRRSSLSYLTLDGPLAADADVRLLLNDARLTGGHYRRGEVGRLGNYRLRRVLGAGATGIAFLAEDVATRVIACVKILRPSLADRPTARARFDREIASLQKIKHANVVSFLDHGTLESSGTALPLMYVVMTYSRGETLARRLELDGRLHRAELAKAVVETTRGLAAIHAAGLVHRDLKPANITLDPDTGAIMILDLGLCDDHAEAGAEAESSLVGTPAYMSPEQAVGRPLDARSDLFVLGSVFYTLATGINPFASEGVAETLARVTGEEPEPLERLRPNLPLEFTTLVRDLMAKDPAQRPATAQDVLTRLGRLNPTTTPAKPNPIPPSHLTTEPKPARLRGRAAGFLRLCGA